MDSDELLVLLRDRVRTEGGSHRFAANHDLSPSYITTVLCGLNKPGPKIAMALGLKKVITFEPIG